MNVFAWLNPGRWLLLLAAVAALIASYYYWADSIGDKREASVRAELKSLADAQTERNRELQRSAEQRYTVQAEVRERVITETIVEVRHATQSLASCPVPADAVRLFNRAASCALGDPAATCGAD